MYCIYSMQYSVYCRLNTVCSTLGMLWLGGDVVALGDVVAHGDVVAQLAKA
jgi:hypothetical protein